MKYLSLILSVLLFVITLFWIVTLISLFLGQGGEEIPIAIEGSLDYFEAKWMLFGQNVVSPLFSLLFLVLFLVCYSWYRRTSRKKKNCNKENVNPPFCLYLRSFVDDKKTEKSVDVQTEEEALVEVLTDIAPVYAIGNPQDKKMPIGASRIYVDDDEWKSVVQDMAQKAEVVALRLGKTDSFWWEVEMAIKNVAIEKILFVVPENKTFNNVANLYKILLEHNIDIKNLDVSASKKRRGSISSFIFFDKNGNVKTKEIGIPRFSRIILSYENILRNALSDFREKFGLSVNKKMTLRYPRFFQFLLIIGLFIMGFSKAFTDYIDLKYQMPYELVEECIKDPVFVDKYSGQINGNNLCYSLIEARKGAFLLDDDSYINLCLIETLTAQRMDLDEFNQLGGHFKNQLLMVKKYCPEHYDYYVSLLSQAACYSLNTPDKTTEIIQLYKNNIEYLPAWVLEFLSMIEDMNDYEAVCAYSQLIDEHIDEEGLADIIKTVESNGINI